MRGIDAAQMRFSEYVTVDEINLGISGTLATLVYISVRAVEVVFGRVQDAQDILSRGVLVEFEYVCALLDNTFNELAIEAVQLAIRAVVQRTESVDGAVSNEFEMR